MDKDVETSKPIPPGERVVLTSSEARVRLIWKSGVDLDLHAYYRLASSEDQKPPTRPGRWWQRLLPGETARRIQEAEQQTCPREGKEGHVYFADKGELEEFPWIVLDQDAGVGDLPGHNEENLFMGNLRAFSHLLVVVNAFHRPRADFGEFNASLCLYNADREYEISLEGCGSGGYCLVLHFDLSVSPPVFVVLRRSQMYEPSLDAFLVSTLLP